MFITYKDCYRYYVVLSTTFRTCPEFVLRVRDKKVMSKHYKLYMNTEFVSNKECKFPHYFKLVKTAPQVDKGLVNSNSEGLARGGHSHFIKQGILSSYEPSLHTGTCYLSPLCASCTLITLSERPSQEKSCLLD